MTNFNSPTPVRVHSVVIKSLLIMFFGSGILLTEVASAQDVARFAGEVSGFLAEKPMVHSGDLIIFTGSSSVRGWKGLSSDFPSDNVINRGFGGSQMSDLLAYLDGLVVKHRPSVVFIYEGDNDIAAGESPANILNEARQVTDLLMTEMPDIEVVFISAKPSISRWHLKTQYLKYNNALNDFAKTDSNVHFADVWTPMLYSDGSLNKTLYIEDGLHMNKRGYEIWAQSLEPLMRKFRIDD